MADSEDEFEEQELLLFILFLRRRRRRVRALSRKIWTKRWIMRRQRQGAYANLISELNVEDPEKFRQFHQMERQHFEHILSMISPNISQTRHYNATGNQLKRTFFNYAAFSCYRYYVCHFWVFSYLILRWYWHGLKIVLYS